jgi:hypothetical protein
MNPKLIVLIVGVVLYIAWHNSSATKATTKRSAGRGAGSGSNRIPSSGGFGAGQSMWGATPPKSIRVTYAAGISAQ